jgi:tetraacyldisaccharide 4'-kinase
MKLPRPFLLFLNPIYWLVTFLRNLFYDLGIFKSTFFNLPIIAIGNLSTGGTGKTPHTEYLIRLLKEKKKIAVLSRGYGRKSVGFQEATIETSELTVGDEPKQMKKKFPDVCVVVDADRVSGVNHLLQKQNPPEVILLDDAFQHRKLQAGFYVLLTPYSHLFIDDWVLPAGNLREPRSGYARANCIVVSKCPATLSEEEKQAIVKRLKQKSHQQLFFSTIVYDTPIAAHNEFDIRKAFVLVTGIAKAAPLVNHLENQSAKFSHLDFPDHYVFTKKDTQKMIATAKEKGCTQLLTTEKDFQRIDIAAIEDAGLTLAYLPIVIKILGNESSFNQSVLDFISSYD